VILIHVLAIVLVAFSFDLLGRILLGLDLAFIVILVCAAPFIIIWGLHRSYDRSRRTLPARYRKMVSNELCLSHR
jgi:hypothetical protein